MLSILYKYSILHNVLIGQTDITKDIVLLIIYININLCDITFHIYTKFLVESQQNLSLKNYFEYLSAINKVFKLLINIISFYNFSNLTLKIYSLLVRT